jgi:3-carboxy-cis,cis-muconate cycloisomerase
MKEAAMTTELDAGLLAPARAGTAVEEVTGDRAWLQAMLDAEAALCRVQARLGLVPAAAAATIAAAARADRFDLADLAHRARGAANPVVAVVADLTAAVAAADPGAADFVHRGCTSQDVMDTAAALVCARALRVILADLDRTCAALAELAERHRDTPMAGRTLTQHAVPITFGLKAAGWLVAVLDARTGLRALLDSGLPVQLGGAAGTLAGYLEYARLGRGGDLDVAAFVAELVAAYAHELDLSEPVLPWHTARSPIFAVGAALAGLTGALGKIAVDVLSLARTEVAEVAEPAATGRGVSSAMPQKRNPALATMIRSAALQVPLLAATLASCMLAEDERPGGAWHAEWQPLRDCLRLAGGAAHTATELVEGLVVDPDRMRANLGLTGGLIAAERLAAVLAPALGKRAAKDLASRASAESGRTGRPLADVLATLPELAGRFTGAELSELLDPANYTGAARELVDRALRHYRGTAIAVP